MKHYIFIFIIFMLSIRCSFAQEEINDKSLRYQEQRMVFRQWDQNKFTPTSGFLGLNPYYWLTWGWFYPNYHKTDLRPLSPTGPQTQRLALVSAMNTVDGHYKLQSDTVRNTALSGVAAQTGVFSDADPLWLLYYKDQFQPVMNKSMASLLAGFTPAVTAKLVSEGTYSWYDNELDQLKQRIEGAHSTDMDRGSRILAYYRLLKEYRKISAVWAVRTSSAQSTLNMTAQRQQVVNGLVPASAWTPHTDIDIANKVLQHVQ